MLEAIDNTNVKRLTGLEKAKEAQDPENFLKAKLFKDVNGDGKFDGEDIKIIREYLEGKRELSEEEKERADVNNDGVVDQEDLYEFLKLLEMRREVKDKVERLEKLYNALLQDEDADPGFVVLGIDNTNVEVVKKELYKARALLAALS